MITYDQALEILETWESLDNEIAAGYARITRAMPEDDHENLINVVSALTRGIARQAAEITEIMVVTGSVLAQIIDEEE